MNWAAAFPLVSGAVLAKFRGKVPRCNDCGEPMRVASHKHGYRLHCDDASCRSSKHIFIVPHRHAARLKGK